MHVVNGLPAHVLLVHFVVVFVPLTGLLLCACAIWPKVARRVGIVLPLLALATVTSVPLTTQAGEWLEARVGSDPLVRRHAELGDGLLPWATALFVMAVAIWWVARRSASAGASGGTSEGAASEGAEGGTSGGTSGGTLWAATPVRIAAAVLSVAVATGAVVDVVRIGDSGAKAAWHDSFSKTPQGGQGDGD